MQPSNQPAKLAERGIAPGDGEAEPGVTAKSYPEPAELATDGLVKRICKVITINLSLFDLNVSSAADFVGYRTFFYSRFHAALLSARN